MTIRIANAPVSWGIYEFKDIEPKYPFTRVLDEIAETGYTGIELGPWGYLPTDPAVLKPELDQRGLQLLSSYVPVKLVDASAHAEGEAHALKVGKLLAACGAEVIVLADDNGNVPELFAQSGRRKGSALSPAQWDVFAAGVNRIARRVHEEVGLKIVFHHHCAGYVETPDETRNLLERTDADLVGLCLDTGHYHYGGGNALEAVKTYGKRVRYLHLKDCDPNIRELCVKEKLNYREATQAGVFCELGQGEVDFPAILTEMEALGYDGWAIVEQDVLTDDLDAPRHSARRNREYLKKLGY
ncbi:MAG: TIM barrel protein [Anaerolineae bacterium]|nr:TIM barrel protein [Anaerolineae bacterium]MBN8621490.1 TIM barrel protein [Anaerolineae bacterium]